MLVDDHAVVRSGLADFLLAYEDLELAGEASSGEDAVLMCGKIMLGYRILSGIIGYYQV